MSINLKFEIRNHKTVKAVLGIVLAMAYILFSQSLAFAQADPLEQSCVQAPQSAICQENNVGQTDASDGASSNTITDTITSVINIISIAVGSISIIVIAIAGLTMTLSQGDSGKIKSSREAIIYAAVGIIVVAIAQAVVIFIINNV